MKPPESETLPSGAVVLRIHSGITFDFDLTPRRVDLVSEPFDVAIRMGESESSQLIARPLASLKPYLYVSPGYLERSGEPSKLGSHKCTGMSC
ncbi:LysR family regulatory protein [Burkholderia cenocepacia]|nr:LysR family regulatory protein [Burkholderia cenocepacia]CAB5103091.1 LysR family regulatory protein [Burkholderia cenocepacia]CAB5129180.1 LysR family regulatory protein [Burkholderia cenocepacia]CAB5140587.1 LysR family regulatory protein [Burkholderia cenocepacia]CAB5140672.1 LysR family regulatory protein [Burkholderia cenocepacia]